MVHDRCALCCSWILCSCFVGMRLDHGWESCALVFTPEAPVHWLHRWRYHLPHFWQNTSSLSVSMRAIHSLVQLVSWIPGGVFFFSQESGGGVGLVWIELAEEGVSGGSPHRFGGVCLYVCRLEVRC
jgi:hypothetical protein